MVPQVKAYLKTHEVDTRTMVTQLKEPVPKLGMARLRLVRHVEALVSEGDGTSIWREPVSTGLLT